MKNSNNTLLGIFVLATIVIVTIAALSFGCTETSDNDNNNTTGNTTDIEYVYGEALVEGTNIIILESFPVQAQVEITGYLPDECTKLEEGTVDFDDENNMFTVDLTTRRPADAICTESLVPYETSVALDVYGLDKGVYLVEVNGVLAEFELETDNILTE